MGYEVTDNFLSASDFKLIQDTMYGDSFPWFYNPFITDAEKEDDKNVRDFQFTHIFYRNGAVNSPFFEVLQPVIDIIKPYGILRIKANLTGSTEKQRESGWHTDYDPGEVKCNTAVLYMNTNDGYTIFKEDGNKVESVENRWVRFDNDMLHSGASCTNAKARMVINFNYI